jgi:high-affinity iron transporter
MEPPPIDFHDLARARQRSLYGLYNTITLGVAGTGMASFSHLPDDDRWALAFHVGSLFATTRCSTPERRRGRRRTGSRFAKP